MEGGNKYVQTWNNNMMVASEPDVKKVSDKDTNYISVSFIPDYARFSMTDLTDDNLALLSCRVYDVVACNENVNVYLNDQEISVSNFRQYVQMVF